MTENTENVTPEAEAIDPGELMFAKVELSSEDFQWVSDIEVDGVKYHQTPTTMAENGYLLLGCKMNRENPGGLVLLYAKRRDESDND